MGNRPPTKQLLRSNMPAGNNHPPLYQFGIPYTYDWMIAYAKRRHLKLELDPEEREEWGGMECIDMRKIDFEDGQDNAAFTILACHLSIQDIQKQCDFPFETGRPFTMEYDGILAFWSNYNMRDRCGRLVMKAAHYKRIAAELMQAMSEEGAKPQEPMWWFDWENDVVRLRLSRPA